MMIYTEMPCCLPSWHAWKHRRICREVDFVVMEDDQPSMFVDCKSTQGRSHRGLSYLKGKYPDVPAVAVNLRTDSDTITRDGIRLVNVATFLGEFV